MNIERVTWDNFKDKIGVHVKSGEGPMICRGQANSTWSLVTRFHRGPNGLTLQEFSSFMPELADMIGTLERREIEINTPDRLGSFIAYLQHHGFPTPILDFSSSPYIAAFFAFCDLQALTSEYASVYIFDFLKWRAHWKETFEIGATNPHVTVLKPKSLGNSRQLNQQGYYLFTNLHDVEAHIVAHEGLRKEIYLKKYELSSNERNYVLADLDSMGINYYSLFGTTDSFCAYLRDGIFQRTTNGKNAVQLIRELQLKHQNSNSASQSTS